MMNITSLWRMIRNRKFQSSLSAMILGIGFASFFFFDLYEFLTFSELREHHLQAMKLVESDMMIAVLIYLSIYILVVTFSLPVASLVTLVGGVLFGSFFGTVWVVLGATIGATIFFVFARSASGLFRGYVLHGSLLQMRKGFERNAFMYLLLCRLVPIFPFFVVNISSVLLGVRLRTYVLATLIGIVPMSFAYASFGAGASVILMRDSIPSLSEILEPTILLSLVGIMILVVLMIIYHAIRVRAVS